jgi:putative oxidoreductase
MAYGLVFLRAVVGLIFFAHGSQKLFGWFGGHGPRGTAGFFGSMGFRAPIVMALLAGASETAGLLFAVGFLTPFAALAMASVMVVAVATVHWKNGFWNMGGGYEFNLTLWTVAIAVAAAGPGRFSIDRVLAWDDNLHGLWWGLGVLGVSILGGLLIVALRREIPAPPEAAATDEALARERAEERITT